MNVCVDVAYGDTAAVAACVCFPKWTDASPAAEFTETIQAVEPYVPGEFYRRELPCILQVLKACDVPVDLVVIDGYVWLGEKKGLGAWLFEALGKKVPVIGVAKTVFAGATPLELARPNGAKPLYITAAGLRDAEALALIGSMHGPFRLPTLLKRVDGLCRYGLRRI